MLVRNAQENIDAMFEPLGILLPKQIMQENAHGIQPQRFRPAQFLINFCGIKSVRLPHFQLVDRRCGNEVAAHQPRLLLIPLVRGFRRPALRGCCLAPVRGSLAVRVVPLSRRLNKRMKLPSLLPVKTVCESQCSCKVLTCP